MIKFKDSEPTKAKATVAKPDDKAATQPAAAKAPSAAVEPQAERAQKPAAPKRKKGGG